MSRNSKHIEDIFSQVESPQADDLLAYVDGKLSAAEARKIEQAMVDDPMLSDAVEGIEEVGTETFSELLAELDQDLDARLGNAPAGKEIRFEPATHTPAPQKSGFRRTYLAIAAAVVLLLAVTVTLKMWNGSQPGSIALDYYEGQTATTLRGGAEQQSEYDRASALYTQGKFQEAATLFGKLPSSEAKLMAGHSYFKLENYPKAADFFHEAMSLDQGNREDAEFNLALCYLLQDRVKEGRKMLRNIAGDEYHIYRDQATEALEDLGH